MSNSSSSQTPSPKTEKTDSPITPNTQLPITLAWAEVEPEYQKAARRLASRLKLPGFRAGKAPVELAIQHLGQEKIIQAVLDKLVPSAYQAAIIAHHKQPLTTPDIKADSVELGQDWTLTAEIAELPELKLGNYQKTIKAAKTEAQREIDKLKKEAPQKTATKPDSSAKNSDQAADSTTPTKPKTKSTQTSSKSAATTDSPALTDQQQQDIILRTIMTKLVAEVKPTVPELLLRHETRSELEELARSLDQFKLSIDDYLQRRQLSFEQLSSELAATALARIQVELVLSELSKAAQLQATEQDIDDNISKIEDETLRQQRQNDHSYRSYVGNILTRQKTIDYLLAL